MLMIFSFDDYTFSILMSFVFVADVFAWPIEIEEQEKQNKKKKTKKKMQPPLAFLFVPLREWPVQHELWSEEWK